MNELIDALRYCAKHDGCDHYIAKECPREYTWECGADCEAILMCDAADAIERLQRELLIVKAENEQLKLLMPGTMR